MRRQNQSLQRNSRPYWAWNEAHLLLVPLRPAQKKQPFCDGSHKGASFTPMNGSDRSETLARMSAHAYEESLRFVMARASRCNPGRGRIGCNAMRGK